MNCEIHGDNEYMCEFYSGTKQCIGKDEILDSGNLSYDKLYIALDNLYNRGWKDHLEKAGKGMSHDPRGCREWQTVLDLCRLHANRAKKQGDL